MIIYLAGAIDRAKDNPAEWTNELTKELFVAHKAMTLPEPLIVYSPYMAFPSNLGPGMGSLDEKHARHLMYMNMTVVESSDLVILHYQPGVETWGTPMEAFRALESEIPVLVWNRHGLVKPPSYLIACAGDMVYGSAKAVARAALRIDPRKIDDG